MTDTLFIVLATLQIYAIFLYAGPIMARQLLYISLKKNPEWASQKENKNSYKIVDIVFTWWSRIIATASAIMTIEIAILNPKPEYYHELAMIPIVVWSLSLFILMAYVYGYLLRIIPKPEVVKATLSSRRISDYTAPWVFYLAYGIMGIISVNYLYQFLIGMIDAEILINAVSYIGFIAILTLTILIYTIKRKHSEFDIMFGEKGRKYEVIVNAIGLYLLTIVIINNMISDLYSVELFTQNMVSLFFGYSVNLFFLWMVSHPKSKEITKDYQVKYSS